MALTEAQDARLAPCLPVQRGHGRLSNLQGLNAILDVAEQGGKWRGLSRRFGKWHTIGPFFPSARVSPACWQRMTEHRPFPLTPPLSRLGERE